MVDYKNTVISIINNEGKEESLCSSKEDEKHISAYNRFVNKFSMDKYNILKYLGNIENKGKITGFDISKQISGEGNIVFFHTDVHNSFLNIRNASVMVPENLTIKQQRQLELLMNKFSDDNFNVYFGVAQKKKRKSKVIYRRVDYKTYKKEIIKKSGQRRNI